MVSAFFFKRKVLERTKYIKVKFGKQHQYPAMEPHNHEYFQQSIIEKL